MQVNWDEVTGKNNVDIYLTGWKSINILYGYYKISYQNYLVWNVLGTSHIFHIPVKEVTSRHKDNFVEHFELTLKRFREDLIEWKSEGLTEPWMLEYYNQFKNKIIF